jgi:predicted RNase H-like HicB family nuclease
MTLRFYPACIEQAEDGCSVFFPDLPGCISVGETVQAAAVNAAEALGLHLEGMAEDGEPLPPPSAIDAPLPDWAAEAGADALARVLIPAELPGRAVRANITLDEGLLSRLDAAAISEGLSRSGYIAAAVRERLRRERDAA